MSISEEPQGLNNDVWGSVLITIADISTVLWEGRRFLATVTGLGLLLAATVAFLIPKEYRSTAQLMPPDQQSLSTSSSLSSVSSMSGSLPSIASGSSLINTKTPGAISIGILGSRTAQDDIIRKFNLLSVYHRKFYSDARTVLSDRTILEENPKSGIVSISVIDRDPTRARDIAKDYVEELNKLLATVNASSAHREREFLEDRLKSLKSDLDTSSTQLSQFSSRNATINPQSQGVAIIEATSKLQADLITAESELSALKAQYSDDNVRVRAVRASIGELQSQLKKVGGIGETENSTNLAAGELTPSLRQLPLLGVTYSDLFRQVTTQEAVYETLTKQYELAKVQEAKELPAVKVLDEPVIAERKDSPRRMVIIAIGVLASAFLASLWLLMRRRWQMLDAVHPVKVLAAKMSQSITRKGHAI